MAKIQLKNYPIWLGDPWAELNAFVEATKPTQIAIVADQNTARHCWPLFVEKTAFDAGLCIQLVPGEEEKNLGSCRYIWNQFLETGLDRRGLVVLLGGGTIGDMGGFAAATWKRGVPFVQMPTTLLAMVDASIGGKLGVDFEGLKNAVGAFRDPEAVFIEPLFLQTLPSRAFWSGAAEMLKHALIADGETWLFFEKNRSKEAFLEKIGESIAVKKRFVEADPLERGERAALNFGHTIGHALESFFLQKGPERKLLHGEAVAHGMVAEAWLSMRLTGLSAPDFERIKTIVEAMFGRLHLPKIAFGELLTFIRNDKKNAGGQTLMALLDGQIGRAVVGQPVSDALIMESLSAIG